MIYYCADYHEVCSWKLFENSWAFKLKFHTGQMPASVRPDRYSLGTPHTVCRLLKGWGANTSENSNDLNDLQEI